MDRIKTSKDTFWKLFKPEIIYYNKTWQGANDDERQQNKIQMIDMYYNAVKYYTEFDIEVALKKHRNNESTFPKISNLRALLYRPPTTHQDPDAFVQIPEDIEERIERAKPKKRQTRLPDQLMRDMKAMVVGRWPPLSKWDETFARWDAENAARPLPEKAR